MYSTIHFSFLSVFLRLTVFKRTIEGLSGKAYDDALNANILAEVENAMLIQKAQSLETIVQEKTGKTVEELVPAEEKIAPPIYLDESPIK